MIIGSPVADAAATTAPEKLSLSWFPEGLENAKGRPRPANMDLTTKLQYYNPAGHGP